MLQRETPHRRTMGLKVETAKQLRGNGAVGAVMFEQARGGRLNFFGPRPPAIAARSTGTPESSFSLSHRFEIGSVKTVETTRANTQFGRALGGIKLASTKSDQDIPNVGSAKTFEQLSKLFTASE